MDAWNFKTTLFLIKKVQSIIRVVPVYNYMYIAAVAMIKMFYDIA